MKISSFENSRYYTFNVDFGLLIFYRFGAKRKKTQETENRSELQNLNFEPGEGPLQMSGSANGVLSSGKDLCHVDALNSLVFAA